MRPGLYLTHKPRGVTSFSRVQAFRARDDRLKICHAGTLDPFAEGLLILLVGPATRLMDFLHAAPKRYLAEVRWGEETDNGDPLGKVIAEGDARGLTPGALDAALEPFLGWQEQVPPSTSAKKIGGEPAYRRVHRGESVSLPASRVYLHAARWLAHDLPRSSQLELVCRGGYYVRALARDVGRRIGCRAHLSALWRSTIGPWDDPGPRGERSSGAGPAPTASERATAPDAVPSVRGVHGAAVLPWAPRRLVSADERRALRARRTITRGALLPGEWTFPDGFPDADPPVCAVEGETLFALLRPTDAAPADAPPTSPRLRSNAIGHRGARTSGPVPGWKSEIWFTPGLQ